MSPKLMIWTSVVLSAVAQMFLKHGVTSVQNRPGRKNGFAATGLAMISEIYIWFWAVSFVAAMGLWLSGLQNLDLSYAYPLVSVGYLLVTVLSAVLFQERVDRSRWLAVAVISVGVMLIAGS